MNRLLALSVLLIFANVSALDTEQEIYQAFQEFITTYHKTYATIDEYNTRYQIFKNTYHEIQHTNQQYEKGEITYTTGINQFADIKPEEFAQRFSIRLKQRQLEQVNKIMMTPTLQDVPDNFDWRSQGAVTPVLDQGACNSAYAMATIANIEGRYFLKTGQLKTFSTQQIIDCGPKGRGCNNIWIDSAFNYLQANGAMTNQYAYTAKEEECKYNPSAVVAKVSNFSEAESYKVDYLKKLLVERGPLTVSVDFTTLIKYKKGIFDPMICPVYPNHWVTLVGYGYDTKAKKAYWIVKNSMGEKWGEKGYFRIIQRDYVCAFAAVTLSADVEAI